MSDVQVLHLDVNLNLNPNTLNVEFNEDTSTLDVAFDVSAGGRLPNYTGAYVVDPRKVEQTLETKNKSMTENVTINEIFYQETSNLSGGLTAVIGME